MLQAGLQNNQRCSTGKFYALTVMNLIVHPQRFKSPPNPPLRKGGRGDFHSKH